MSALSLSIQDGKYDKLDSARRITVPEVFPSRDLDGSRQQVAFARRGIELRVEGRVKVRQEILEICHLPFGAHIGHHSTHPAQECFQDTVERSAHKKTGHSKAVILPTASTWHRSRLNTGKSLRTMLWPSWMSMLAAHISKPRH